MTRSMSLKVDAINLSARFNNDTDSQKIKRKKKLMTGRTNFEQRWLAKVARKLRVAFLFGSLLGLFAIFAVWQFRHVSVKEETEISPKEETAIPQPRHEAKTSETKTSKKEIAPETTV